MLKELIVKNRSYRRFYQQERIDYRTLKELVDLARLSPSSANLQPLKYILSWKEERNALIFPCLKWAGYLKDWDGPEEGERPAGYIIILGDREISQSFAYDCGICAQTILLGAVEKGWGGCIIGSIERDALRRALDIPSRYEILLVLALGKPKEEVRLVESKGEIRYWRDEKGVHYVPKRGLEEIILNISQFIS
ncbi:MAG: nitroreductase [Candidatus Omnitrophota bacterium]|nr:MAG: nitroreductase [Candidatus Omnitrophota bacterium]